MKEKLDILLNEAKKEISECETVDGMNVIKSKYLGKTSELTNIMKSMSSLNNEEKKPPPPLLLLFPLL